MTKIVSCFNARSSGKENGEKIKYIICSYSSSEIVPGHKRHSHHQSIFLNIAETAHKWLFSDSRIFRSRKQTSSLN
jgi:hypothetical protein